VLALQRPTRTIPVVFVVVPDPVGLGVVQSLARPGGNITGFTSYEAPMVGKWLQLLKEAAPGVTRVAVLFTPDTAFAPAFDREIEAARSLGVTVTLARAPGGSLVIVPDSFNVTHREVILAAAARHRVPLISWEVPRAGGLMSY